MGSVAKALGCFFSLSTFHELKVNRDADAAIDQIRRKQYPTKILEYSGEILLVSINYNRETKEHSCQIERFTKA